MDAMRALTAADGCTVDGTAASRNPLSQFFGQAMQGPKQGGQMGVPPQGMAHQDPRQANAIERGMNANRIGMHDPRNRMRGPGPAAAPQNEFLREFEQMHHQPGNPMMAGPRGPMHHPQNGWVDDFQRMNMNGGPQYMPNPNMEAAFKASFARPPPMMANKWAAEMKARGPVRSGMDNAWKAAAPASQGEQWAKEMSKPAGELWAEEINAQEQTENPDMAATRQATDEMVRVMAQNPRYKDSKFFDFMSKVSSGELSFKDNTVVENPEMAGKSMENAWKETSAENPKFEDNLAQSWANEAENANPMQAAWNEAAKTGSMGEVEELFSKAWQDSMDGKDVDFNAVWSKAIDASKDGGFEQAWSQQEKDMSQVWHETQTANPADTPYELNAENPYTSHSDPYQEGLVLFREGQLPEAILAFEAAVQKDMSHADAWRMLGVAHQENDEDRKAIACLERAVEQDAYHLDALLGLGVSYVNELDQERALKNLKAWVVNNPNFQGLEVAHDAYSDGSLMDDVMQLMVKAAEWAPNDSDVQEVLGVLYNVSRDYDSAVVAFRNALAHKPDEYALWNKLGATLANGSKSEEAIPVYHRALELKPKYARGWLNLGISQSNLGKYFEAARCYLKALELNPNASHIWSYLRICFTCMERFDLIALADAQNLEGFRQEFLF